MVNHLQHPPRKKKAINNITRRDSLSIRCIRMKWIFYRSLRYFIVGDLSQRLQLLAQARRLYLPNKLGPSSVVNFTNLWSCGILSPFYGDIIGDVVIDMASGMDEEIEMVLQIWKLSPKFQINLVPRQTCCTVTFLVELVLWWASSGFLLLFLKNNKTLQYKKGNI